MDKKNKKRIDVLQQRKQKLLQQLSGAKKQPDDPSEPQRIEAEIAEIDREVEKLKKT